MCVSRSFVVATWRLSVGMALLCCSVAPPLKTKGGGHEQGVSRRRFSAPLRLREGADPILPMRARGAECSHASWRGKPRMLEVNGRPGQSLRTDRGRTGARYPLAAGERSAWEVANEAAPQLLSNAWAAANRTQDGFPLAADPRSQTALFSFD